MKFAKLREMEKLSKGNPEKMARYASAKSDYDDTITAMFTEGALFEFVGCPNEGYVKDAEAHAATTGDADDLSRAAILRDRYEAYEDDKTTFKDLRTTATSLRAKLQNGDELTPKDVRDAWRLAKLNASIDNVALYSRIKREQENPSERPPAPAEVKVTAEDVEAAKTAAQRNPSPAIIARYASTKRDYEAQTEGTGE
ncbi:hypothetical protein [Paenibacillus wynnii]|uniref:Uncharacterized protein n=1 Tax=Paenibacillus wynnii TaxID=268407 RepID=A0A098MGX2_9BACL|nr:hypothetical protein [Paenibacillus wynnii]KGE20797.1 hypothetical protein PWYN_01045 [Paenibacillus wynnii]